MLVESLIKVKVELQGFRILGVTGDAAGSVVRIGPDDRFAPRCSQRLERAAYRDTRPMRHG